MPSAVEVFTNQAQTTVTSGGTTAPAGGSTESWTVASSASFPAVTSGTTQFHVADPAAPSELIAVTAVSGATWTVTRGAEASAPVAHTAGFTVQQVVTAGYLGFCQQGYGGDFGDGSDGAATLDGTATVAWASLAGSTYTMSRDCTLTSLTVNSGITLAPAGRRIWCAGPVTSAGTIAVPGNNATGATAGGVTGSLTIGGGVAGGAGATGNGVVGTSSNSAGQGSGGAGGAGGTGTAGAGGTARSALTYFLKSPAVFLAGLANINGTVQSINGGSGGGGGGGDGTNSGGGGGGGGGNVAIMAWTVVNTGTINVNGGNGGNGAGGNAGGGGGGAGGLVLIFSLVPWTNTGTATVAGGSGGTKTGTGVNGSSGGTGSVLNILMT